MKTALIVALLCMTAAGAGVWWHFRTITVAYRLTLQVRVNGETFAGSGVVGTDIARNVNPLSGGQPFAFHDRGEAVTVDLGRYGLLFLALRGRYDITQLVMQAYGGPARDEDGWDYYQNLRQPGPAVEIRREALPLLVRFHDVSDPNTAECVDPDHMEASFPPGTSVTLVHANLATVAEHVTTGTLEKRLPWLALPWPEMTRLLTGPVWQWLPHWGQKTCLLNLNYLEASK